MADAIDFRPIILAGGSGTRFWPRSRRARAKQVLALDGERTMIQRTLDRLATLARGEDAWVITNALLSGAICAQLKGLPEEQVICEPAARNTAPAAGLAAFLLERLHPGCVLGVFPSDHVIVYQDAFTEIIRRAVGLAAAGENIVVLGIEPTRPETGYGYIETGSAYEDGIARVRRFTEKPNRERAEEFVAAGNYYWNSGMFVWSASTLANAVREYMPDTAPLLEEIVAAWGTARFGQVFGELYPKCENISLDYAVLEPRSAKGEARSHLFCMPARFGWSDLGSWGALYEYQVERNRADDEGNVTESARTVLVNAHNNYVHNPHRFVALVGVEDLVVVETEDALLIANRHHAQDVGKVVKELDARGHEELI